MRRAHVVALLFAVALTSGCGGAGSRPDARASASGSDAAQAGHEDAGRAGEPPVASAGNQPLAEFDPLTRGDVELYLKVMRTAAERAKNLSAADREALNVFRHMTTNPPASGAMPSVEQMAAMQRAGDLMALDGVVAREMGVSKRFGSISSRVATFIGPPMSGEGDDEPMSAEQRAQLKVRIQRFRDREKQDAAILAPFRDELAMLDRQVHFMTRPDSTLQ